MDALLFFPLAFLIALTPGPNNFCAMNNGIRQGVGAAVLATAGRAAAFAIFLTISAVGLGAMLLASETAFNVLKWAGAAYLFWLGAKAWRSRELGGSALVDEVDAAQRQAAARPRRWREMAAQEFLIGISNPKAMVLFAAVFPQFLDPTKPAAVQFVVLGGTYLAAEFLASFVYGAGGRQLRRIVRSSRGIARLNKATGGVFIGAGGLLLASHR